MLNYRVVVALQYKLQQQLLSQRYTGVGEREIYMRCIVE